MKYLIFFLLVSKFSLGYEEFQINEKPLFTKERIDKEYIQSEQSKDKNGSNLIEFEDQNIDLKRESFRKDFFKKAQIDSSFIGKKASKSIYVNYEKIPKVIFKNQKFSIDLNARVTIKNFDRIETRFIDEKNITILNPENKWVYDNKSYFYNKYYFKVNSNNFSLPVFQVLLYKNEKIFEIITLQPKRINYSNISQDNEKFSNVIANNLSIVTHKTKQYTNNQLLTILELEAAQGNLEDFDLKEFQEKGIHSIEGGFSKQTAIYYAIIPIYTKEVVFEYYNSNKNELVTLRSEVVLKNELVSTQTDLNPNKSNLLFYKKVFIVFFIIIFLLFFVIRRKFIFIFLFLIFVIIFILYNLPHEIAKVRHQSNVYILPTNKSTIFYKTKEVHRVELLGQKGNFVKVLFKKSNQDNKIIGWIKEENIVKN